MHFSKTSGLLLLGTVFLSTGVMSTRALADPVHIYVEMLTLDPGIQADPGAMTSPLCAELAKDKDLEVNCAPDIQQMMSFAATTGLIGGHTPSSGIAKRLEQVAVVVTPQLKKSSKGIYLVVSIAHRAPGFGEQVMAPGKFIGKLLVKTGQKSVSAVLPLYRATAETIAAKILTPQGKVPPPPEPVQ